MFSNFDLRNLTIVGQRSLRRSVCLILIVAVEHNCYFELVYFLLVTIMINKTKLWVGMRHAKIPEDSSQKPPRSLKSAHKCKAHRTLTASPNLPTNASQKTHVRLTEASQKPHRSLIAASTQLTEPPQRRPIINV